MDKRNDQMYLYHKGRRKKGYNYFGCVKVVCGNGIVSFDILQGV